MSTNSDLTIVFNPDGGADAKFVRERLDLYNVGITGVSTWYPVNFFVKSGRGETLGGVMGAIWGGWLHVGFLWVDDSVRGKDWGTRLMDQAEAYMSAAAAIPSCSTPILPGAAVLRGPRLRGVLARSTTSQGAQEILPEEDALMERRHACGGIPWLNGLTLVGPRLPGTHRKASQFWKARSPY